MTLEQLKKCVYKSGRGAKIMYFRGITGACDPEIMEYVAGLHVKGLCVPTQQKMTDNNEVNEYKYFINML
jgi:hypothetical protein